MGKSYKGAQECNKFRFYFILTYWGGVATDTKYQVIYTKVNIIHDQISRVNGAHMDEI